MTKAQVMAMTMTMTMTMTILVPQLVRSAPPAVPPGEIKRC